MAAIVHKLAVFLGTVACIALPLRADRATDVRAPLRVIATALTARNATDAIAPFDKSFANYDKLRGYFEGITAFQAENQLDVTDEQDTGTDTILTVTWDLTLTDLDTDYTDRRTADITVHLVLKDGKWKIVDFSPIDIFNPLQRRH